jgi:hypothetical protein
LKVDYVNKPKPSVTSLSQLFSGRLLSQIRIELTIGNVAIY